MSRRSTPVLLAVVALAVVTVGIVLATSRPPPDSMSARVDAVGSTLKCPTCEAESVSASNTPIAQSMRSEIRQQLDRGRTPAQIRSWFESRYGPQVVLLPRARGQGLVLWVTPVLLLLVGLVVIAHRYRKRAAPTAPSSPPGALTAGRIAVAAGACLAAGVAVPVAVWLRSPAHGTSAQPAVGAATTSPAAMTLPNWLSVGASLDAQKDYAGAARAYHHALRLDPRSAALRTRLAFDLLRSGRAQAAEPLVRDLAGRAGPQRPMALLVLGLAQRTLKESRSTATLSTFLKVAPRHPAASQVRRLLEEDR